MARFQFPGRSPGGFSWPTVDQAAERLQTRFDSNQDGDITVAEIVGTLDPEARAGDGLLQLVQRVVGWMDDDADDTISATELTAAMNQLDRNDDGVLSPADLWAGLNRHGEGQTQVLAVLLASAPAERTVEPAAVSLVGVRDPAGLAADTAGLDQAG